MALRLCAGENLSSTSDGVGLSPTWFPRIVAQSYVTATKDGTIKRAPDPVPTISGDVVWTNTASVAQNVTVTIRRAPRTVATTSPNTVVIHDAWSWAKGLDATADYPSVSQETLGGGFQTDRPETDPKDIQRGYTYFDFDASQTIIHLGDVGPDHNIHVRYIAAIQTPGTWTVPSEFEPRWEANARYAWLTVIARPAIGIK